MTLTTIIQEREKEFKLLFEWRSDFAPHLPPGENAEAVIAFHRESIRLVLEAVKRLVLEDMEKSSMREEGATPYEHGRRSGMKFVSCELSSALQEVKEK